MHQPPLERTAVLLNELSLVHFTFSILHDVCR
jgi:hypothetical protein